MPKRSIKHSVHRDGKKTVKIERQWKQEHIDAGYHQQDWGELPTEDHDLVGRHGHLIVEFVPPEEAHTGAPEFRITLNEEFGEAVTVVDADTVRAYLELHGVK